MQYPKALGIAVYKRGFDLVRESSSAAMLELELQECSKVVNYAPVDLWFCLWLN